MAGLSRTLGIFGAFVAVVGAAFYPIYFRPLLLPEEYSEFLSGGSWLGPPWRGVCSGLGECWGCCSVSDSRGAFCSSRPYLKTETVHLAVPLFQVIGQHVVKNTLQLLLRGLRCS